MLNELLRELEKSRDSERAKLLGKYFKTGKGEYGDGDIFLGLTVPRQREIAKKYTGLNLVKIRALLKSRVHEHRLVGLLILVEKFKKADENGKADIFNFYIKNLKNANNWDLVDLSAPKIPGEFLKDKNRTILHEIAKSKNLWEKRASIVSTFPFIADNDFADSLKIAEYLLQDEHDLIHKATGWALREVGKKNKGVLEAFLKKNIRKMPRTTLRYAIEKFPQKERKKWLDK